MFFVLICRKFNDELEFEEENENETFKKKRILNSEEQNGEKFKVSIY